MRKSYHGNEGKRQTWLSASLATVLVFFACGLAMTLFCAFKWAHILSFG